MKGKVKWKVAQELEIRWWRRYLRKRDVGEYLEWKREYWKRFLQPLEHFIDTGKAKNILDAGCGPAGIFIMLEGCPVTAIDPLLDQYERDLPHFNKADHSSVHFVTTPLEAFSADEPFDLVFCLNAINHVSDMQAAMQVLFNSLSPAGTMVLSIDCHRYAFLRTLFRCIPGDALHPHQDTIEDYRSMIRAFGGEILLEKKEKPGRIFDYFVLVIRKSPDQN